MKFLKVVPLILAATVMIGCASAGAKYVKADSTALQALLDAKAEKDEKCDAEALPESTCKALSAAFIPVIDGYLGLNKAVLAGGSPTEVDALLRDLKAAVVDLKDVVNEIKDDRKDLLLDLVETFLRKL